MHQTQDLKLYPDISPPKIAILCLINCYCTQSLPPTTESQLLLAIAQLIQGPPHPQHVDTTAIDLDLTGLIENLNNHMEGDFVSLFIDHMWSLPNLDSLYTFIKESRKLVSPSMKTAVTGQSKALTCMSLLGKFVTNVVYSFDSLEFDDLLILWESFLDYREPTRTSSQPVDDVLNEGFVLGREKVVVASQLDVIALIDHQIQSLQKFGTKIPPLLNEALLKLARSEVSLPSSNYIKYLESLKAGDFDNAITHLHCYFDYMMSSKRSNFYHYALLSLASLYATAGQNSQALSFVEEAVRVARENKDFSCLNYLLTWLLNFLRERPFIPESGKHFSRDRMLKFLQTTTKDCDNWSLYSLTYQFNATELMLTGGSLISILESMLKSCYTSLSLSTTTFDSNLILVNCYELLSSIWLRSGNVHLSEVYLNIALSAIKNPTLYDVNHNLTLNIRKACIHFYKGEVETSFEVMHRCEPLAQQDVTFFKRWSCRRWLLELSVWVRKCRYKRCLSLIQNLEKQVDHVGDLQLTFEFLILKSDYLCSIGNFSDGLQLVTEMLGKLETTPNHYNHYWFIKLQIYSAQLVVKSTSAKSACYRKISSLLNAVKMAHKSHFLPLVADGILVLAEIQVKLETQPHELHSFLESCSAIIHETKNLYKISHLYYLLALVGLKKLHLQTLPITHDDLNVHLEYLEKSISGFKTLSDFKFMKQAFMVEYELASLTSQETLKQHAIEALEKLDLRITEEMCYGVV